MGKSLYEKVFDEHVIRRLPSGQYQLFIGLHLLNDITSPQGFDLLREKGLSVLYPGIWQPSSGSPPSGPVIANGEWLRTGPNQGRSRDILRCNRSASFLAASSRLFV